MKRKIIKFSKIVASMALFYLFLTKWSYDNSNAFSSILTFLSIISGFSITALSIIATSNFSNNLFLKESEKNNSQTLLHELVYDFRNSSLLFIATIILILLFEFVPESECMFFTFKIYYLSFTSFLKALIWYMTVISFAKFIYLLFTFSKFIISSVSNK